MKKKSKLISKKQLLLVTVFVALVIVLSTVFAVILSKKEVENVFTGANLSVEVLEEGVTDGTATFTADGDDYTAKKLVSIKNTSSGSNAAREYIRVCIIPKFINNSFDMQTAVMDTGDNGNFPLSITGNSYTMSDITFNLASGWDKYWSYKNDGYFYYNTEVVSGETTASLLDSVTVAKSVLNKYTSAGLSLKVVVLADAIQTVGGAVESRWSGSGLASNDEERPSEASDEGSISALSLEDEATSQSAVDTDEYISDYDMQLAEGMVSAISVTVYEPPEEDDSDNSDNSETQDTDDTDAVNDTEVSENKKKTSIGDYEPMEKALHTIDAVSDDE